MTRTVPREQVARAILAAATKDDTLHPGFLSEATDAVLVVFAERERLLRERIEALDTARHGESLPVHKYRADVLAVFDA